MSEKASKLTMYKFKGDGTTLFLENIQAVRKGDPGLRMVYVYLHVKDLPKTVTVHAWQDEMEDFMAQWKQARQT